jgi:PadR family transcriptional regulator PadR
MDQDPTHVRKLQKELNAGVVALVLLALIERADASLYGYQIAKLFEDTDPDLQAGKQGALYPVLRQLSAQGFLDSWVEPSTSGPPRRYYRITAAGRTALADWRQAWTRTRDFVDHALSTAGARRHD